MHTRKLAAQAAAFLHDTGRGLLGLVYPNVCAACGRRAEAVIPLCPACWRQVERADAGEVAAQLAHLPASAGVFDDVFALWIFREGSPLRAVHHRLKYGNRPRYGSALGEQVGAALLASDPAMDRPDVILPVPLHCARYLERGYNQSAMLAEGIARALGVPGNEDVLVRERATLSQTELSRDERWENVQGAFAVVKPEAVNGRRVLLVDDVLTTGATLCAAGQALRRCGAAAIDVAALAFARM